jgi:hypothetical protein
MYEVANTQDLQKYSTKKVLPIQCVFLIFYLRQKAETSTTGRGLLWPAAENRSHGRSGSTQFFHEFP